MTNEKQATDNGPLAAIDASAEAWAARRAEHLAMRLAVTNRGARRAAHLARLHAGEIRVLAERRQGLRSLAVLADDLEENVYLCTLFYNPGENQRVARVGHRYGLRERDGSTQIDDVIAFLNEAKAAL